MLKRLKEIRLTRTQKLIRNSILLVLTILVLIWTFGDDFPGYKTSDEALEAMLTGQLGIPKPYDIVADYQFYDGNHPYEGESRYGREVYVRTTLNGESVIVWAPIYYDEEEQRWNKNYAPAPEVLERAELFDTSNVSLKTSLEHSDRNWVPFKGDIGYLGLGSQTYGMLLEEEDHVTIQLDCLNDYISNRTLAGGHLEYFSPEISFNYYRDSERIKWNEVSVRCRILGMTLTDEQAAAAARKLVELYDGWHLESEGRGEES